LFAKANHWKIPKSPGLNSCLQIEFGDLDVRKKSSNENFGDKIRHKIWTVKIENKQYMIFF